MRIIKTKNYEEMSLVAADFLFSQILLRPNCVLGLATGSTPLGIYSRLTQLYGQGRLDFSGVSTVNLDEYVGLPAGHAQSYARFMRENFFDGVNINPANTHIPNGAAEDLERECADYDETIRRLGGIDLQLLGVGNNGHIGFNEPDGSFPAGTHRVRLTESTHRANCRFFDSIDAVPTHALTMGIRDIMGARRIVVVASGKSKAQAVRQMLTGPVIPQMPASILQFHRDCTLIADEAALDRV